MADNAKRNPNRMATKTNATTIDKKGQVQSALLKYAKTANLSREQLEQHVQQLTDIRNNFESSHYANFQEKDSVKVTVHHIESPLDFFITKVSLLNELDSLQSVLQKTLQSCSSKIYIPHKGVICAVKVDSIWYRAQIYRVHSNETCDVLLLDIGARKNINWEHIVQLEPCLVRITPMAIECKLQGLTKTAKDLTERFRQICDSAESIRVLVTHVAQRCDVLMFVAYSNVGEICINEELNMDVKPIASFTEDDCIDDEKCVLHSKTEEITGIKDLKYILDSELIEGRNDEKCDNGEMEPIAPIGSVAPTVSIVESNDEIELISHPGNINTPKVPETENVGELGAADRQPNSLDVVQSNEQNGANTLPKLHISETTKPIELSKRSRIELLHVESPAEFYVCLQKKYASLNKLHRKIQKLMVDYEKLEIIESPTWQKNDLCVAYTTASRYSYSAPCWYRGRIVDISSCDIIIFLLDVGETVHVEETSVAVIDDNLKRVESVAIKCRMACVRPLNGLGAWPESSGAKLRAAASGFDFLSISIQGISLDGTSSVVLWGTDTEYRDGLTPGTTTLTNVNQKFADTGMAEIDGCFIDIEDPHSATSDNNDENYIAELSHLQIEQVNNDANEMSFSEDMEKHIYEISSNFTKVEHWLPSDPIDRSIFAGTPTYVDSKMRVYLLDDYRLLASQQIEVQIRMSLQRNALEKITGYWEPFQPCFARFHGDGKFHRGQIRRVVNDKKICVVRFVDYGNTEKVAFEDLRIATILGNVPILTRRYTIHGVEPLTKDGRWPTHVVDITHAQLVDKLCNILVINYNKRHEEDAACQISAGPLEVRTFLISNNLAMSARAKPKRLNQE